MGLIPIGERESGPTDRIGFNPDGTLTPDNVTLIRVQVAFLFCGAIVGVLGILLPHPDYFMDRELVLLNCLSWITAAVTWVLAPRIGPTTLRLMPAFGTILITASVIFSRDPTSAYALLYLFPCVYAYYFLNRFDSAAHILFASVNYGAAVAVISTVPGAAETDSGSVLHHIVITIGTLIVVGSMLTYLRTRVNRLMATLLESARTDVTTGLLNAKGLGEALGLELDRARIDAGKVSLLSVSFRGLGELRSKRGDAFAEARLADIGTLLNDSTRRIDTVGRTGQAEFEIVLPGTDEHTGFLLAEQLLSRLRRSLREWQAPLNCSVGVTVFPNHAAGVEALRQAGATAHEAARDLGGDRAVVYSVDLERVLADDRSKVLSDRRTHLSTVLSLAEVLELRDARSATHAAAVARYCEMIAAEMGLSTSRIKRLHVAGLLHDIGKVGVGDTILDKPGPLSPVEWDQVRRHPEMAARILGARELADIREWVLARHEQPDGHGYPRGISGDDVPLESRILAVAESYDAIMSDRPYRPARSSDEAIAEIGRYSGSQFDGAVVDALVRALERAGVGSPERTDA